MNRINYDARMREIIDGLECKPPLFLHSCCAPCSSRCIEELAPHFDITVVYYNPNIDTDLEYARRAEEQRRFLSLFSSAKGVKFVEFGHCAEDFAAVSAGREALPEGGARCAECYRLRLAKAASLCPPDGYFATTLTISPLKNAKTINKIGEETAKLFGVRYLPTDFKKRGGYLRSIELSAEYALYRQNYCGCVFSKRERFDKSDDR